MVAMVLPEFRGAESFFGKTTPLPLWSGYAIVLGFGAFFSLVTTANPSMSLSATALKEACGQRSGRRTCQHERSPTLMSASTCASSGSGAPDSDCEDAGSPATLAGLMSALRVRNSFLEFPPWLFLGEDLAQQRRSRSAPCRMYPPSAPAPPKAVRSLALSALIPPSMHASSGDVDSAGRAPARPVPSELPSLGSAEHHRGKCKPCAFIHKQGCNNGTECRFCHLCGPEVKKKRQLERLDHKRRLWREKAKLAARQSAAYEGESP